MEVRASGPKMLPQKAFKKNLRNAARSVQERDDVDHAEKGTVLRTPRLRTAVSLRFGAAECEGPYPSPHEECEGPPVRADLEFQVHANRRSRWSRVIL